MENNLLYTVGELLMTEAENVEDIRYTREEKNCLYIITKEGEEFKLILEKKA